MGGGIFVRESKVNNGEFFECDLTDPLEICTDAQTPQRYTITAIYSGLPVVEIHTPNEEEILNKDKWIENSTIRIIKPNGEIDLESAMSVKARGNATFRLEKKGYSLKLDNKSEVLGMSQNKRWVLLANAVDKSLIRNALGLEISRLTCMQWTPRGTFVELVINGEHRGNYFLCESIKIGKNRVNVKDLQDGDKLTGGYVLEVDSHYDEDYKFKSPIKNLPYMFHDPDKISNLQYEYIRDYIAQTENAIYDDILFADEKYLEYIDLDTFADWWIATEITQNHEPNEPNSVFMNKDQGEKLKMGPVWDFDVYTFNSTFRLDTLAIRNALYYDKLFESPAFIRKLKERWMVLKPQYESQIPAYITEISTKIEPSVKLNYYLWPYKWEIDASNIDWTTPDNILSWMDSYTSYEDAIDKINSSFMKKLRNLDLFITHLSD